MTEWLSMYPHSIQVSIIRVGVGIISNQCRGRITQIPCTLAIELHNFSSLISNMLWILISLKNTEIVSVIFPSNILLSDIFISENTSDAVTDSDSVMRFTFEAESGSGMNCRKHRAHILHMVTRNFHEKERNICPFS